jgi:predicted ABC-type ATPase
MPVVTMIAGPNGSGKTTLTKKMLEFGVDLGVYINPDEIAASFVGDYNNRVRAAQVEADRLRDGCILAGQSFAFETVMSHRSKIEVLTRAKSAGFDVALYFVSTSDPRINVDRVRSRVLLGGHDVPTDKIAERYRRTMSLLPDAISAADRSYLFDNTGIDYSYLSRKALFGERDQTDIGLVGRFGSGLNLTLPQTTLRLVGTVAMTADGLRSRLYPPIPAWADAALRHLT